MNFPSDGVILTVGIGGAERKRGRWFPMNSSEDAESAAVAQTGAVTTQVTLSSSWTLLRWQRYLFKTVVCGGQLLRRLLARLKHKVRNCGSAFYNDAGFLFDKVLSTYLSCRQTLPTAAGKTVGFGPVNTDLRLDLM